MEFDRLDRAGAAKRIERGTQVLMEAGFPRPETFVAPYDKLSRASMAEVAARFRVLSTGWFEAAADAPHLVAEVRAQEAAQSRPLARRRTWLLSHPGCLLSCHRPRQ